MRLWLRVVIVLGYIAGLIGGVTPSAQAKGASQAIVSGPGLSSPVVLSWRGDGQAYLADLLETGAFFLQGCGPCDGRLAKNPRGSLGPRYLVTYSFETRAGSFSRPINEYVWPFADQGPVVYWIGGQRSPMGTTVEGWVSAKPGLTGLFHQLIDLAPPAAAPTPSNDVVTDSGTFPAARVALLVAVLIAVTMLALIGLRRWRGRPRRVGMSLR